MDLKGSKTEANLLAAFAGESQARNKYTFFASIAKREGYEQISSIFLETAENEREHAKLFLKAVNGLPKDTLSALLAAAGGEEDEHTAIYPKFAQTAREEGFEAVANLFDAIAKIEAHHEARYRELADLVKAGEVFKKSGETTWICRNCGHIHTGAEAPGVCPVCKHPQSFFQQLTEEF